MKLSKVFVAILGFAAATAFSGSALAQAKESAWYLGASIGQSKFKNDCGASGVSCDMKDTAWKLFGGYQFNRYIAAEGAYVDLGSAKSSSGSASAKIESTAWELVGVGSYPIGTSGFSPYAKAGLYRGDSDLSSNFGMSGNGKNTDWTAGLGLRYDFTKALAVRAEWQRYNNIGGGGAIGESDVDVLSIGALWKF